MAINEKTATCAQNKDDPNCRDPLNPEPKLK